MNSSNTVSALSGIKIKAISASQRLWMQSKIESGNLSPYELLDAYLRAEEGRLALLAADTLHAEFTDAMAEDAERNGESCGPQTHGLTYYALVRVYEQGGQGAVEAMCAAQGWTDHAHCAPCEVDTPTIDGVCAVCGSVR